MIRVRIGISLALAGFTLPLVLPVVGQRTGSLQPRVFAIRGATVIVEAGKPSQKATVVMRDGMITAVGPNAAIPPDAEVIDGSGQFVYPGFIDALHHRGFDGALRRSEVGAAAPEDLAAESLAVTKPDNRKGMTPEFRVATALTTDAQAEHWRRIGFTAGLAAPEGGIITGQSAVVSLSGMPPREAILRTPVALHAALRTVPGGDYPRVLMGVVAHARQTLLDAGHFQRLSRAFTDGVSTRRPPHDPALAALADALAGRQPVVIESDVRDGMHRALDFAAEFKLRPILHGGRDAWKVAERLKRENVPVVLRLNFSDPAAQPGRPEGTPPLPSRVLEERKREHDEEVRCAVELHNHGISIAFSTAGLAGDQPWNRFRENLRKVLAAGLPAEAALRALTTDAAKLLGVERQLGAIAVGRPAHLILMNGPFEDEKSRVRFTFADGIRFEADASAPPSTPEKKKSLVKKIEPRASDAKPEKKQTAKKDSASELPTEMESDRRPHIRTGGNVLIRGATLITVSHGTLTDSDLLVKDGKIAALGKGLQAPPGVKVLDATGLFVMPGIIDTHCHFAIAGGVNEFSLSVVPEVRVRDVIDGEDVQIYRALAGGVTTARLLHGSANCIGGQDAVIKLRYGQPAHRLLLADAPRGVKFALGENVKRTDGRFPNTRLGVEAVLVRAFSEAQAYQRSWQEYAALRAAGKPALEPRRDLRLEALGDILRGDLKVHCHCYRSDEILMLLRVADRFGIKIQSLQHVLEGYKVAAEIAAHGASCSPFADWWAYKIEAYEAIPHNAALLREAGVPVCLKSDSNELMRHLYQEAAKTIKYGGMGEADAFKLITLHGAKQLGLEKRIGSLEVGKDADLAIFNGHPLNGYSRVEMTLVDGEVYFQRSEKQSAFAPAAVSPSKPWPARLVLRPSKAGAYALADVTIHPVSGPTIPGGTVLVENGKVTGVFKGRLNQTGQTAIGNREGLTLEFAEGDAVLSALVPEGTTIVRLPGVHVYPGMIDAGSVIGLIELESARETQDFSEGGDFQPDLRASVAVNPDSELIPVTRANGVLTVVTQPTGGILAGQSALLNLAGWVPREMAVVDPLALHVQFPAGIPVFTGNPVNPRIGRAYAKKQRDEKIRRLKELFRQAMAYDAARKLTPGHPVNPRLEALVPYALGEKLVIIQANRKPELEDALKLADELKIKVALSGGIESWKIAGELKKRDVPVILGPVMTMPQESHDPYDSPYACAAKLHAAGVRFCIRSEGNSNTRNLPYEAAMAASYGLPIDEALKAVTLAPAQILGVADQIGSIDVGKRANLVLSNGDLLQPSTQVLALFLDGKPLEPTSKHTQLYDRYRERLREVKEGRAPLGTK